MANLSYCPGQMFLDQIPGGSPADRICPGPARMTGLKKLVREISE